MQAGLDRLPIGFALFDPKWRLVGWNAALASICGYPQSFLATGTRVETFLRFNAERGDYGPGKRAALIRERLAVLKRRTPTEREQRLADGRTMRISIRPVPLGHRLVTFEDVTGARLAEQRYNFASRAVNEGIYDWDIASGKIYFSERVYNVLGFSPRDYRTVAGWRKRIHPDDLAQFDSGIVAHLKGRTERFECDYRFRARDGNWRWARQHGIVLRDASGRALRMIGSTGDITELKRTADALKTSEERYALAMRAATEGVYEWDLDTRKLYISDTTKAFFWSRTDTLTPASWNERVHPEDLTGYRQAIVDHFKGRTPQFELEYRTRDATGGYLWVLDRGIGVRDERGRVRKFVGAVSDITQRKLAEQELRRAHEETTKALERQTATAEILHVIASSPTDVQPVLDAVATRAALLCEARDAIIQLRDGDLFRFAAHYGPIPNLGVGGTRRISRGTVVGRSMLEGRQIHVHDLQAETAEFPEGSAYAREFGYHTSLVTPLMRKGTAIGTIMVRRTEVRPFSDKQLKLVQTFADQAVIAIENARLFNETKEALDRQTATAEILRAISGSPADVTPVFETILSNATRLCDSPLAAIFRFDGKLLHLVATKNLPPEALAIVAKRYPMAPDRSQTSGRTILTKSIVLQPDTLADSEYDQAAAAVGTWRRMLGVPMLRDAEPIGAFVVAWPEPGETPERHVQLLKTFADQAVIAIENVRLFNETKEALDRQTATAEILRVISSTPTDTQPVFDAIVQSALKVFAGTGVGIALVEGERIRVVAAGGNLGPMATKVDMPLSRESATGTATVDRIVVNIKDTEAPEAPPYAQSNGRALGFRAIAAAPMLREGTAIGAIGVTLKDPGGLSDKQVELLKTFADQAVIAIENVRLFQKLQQSNREISDSLEQQTATAEILKVISSSPTDVQPVFDAIVQSAARLFAPTTVGLNIREGNQLQLRGLAGPMFSDTARELIAKLYPIPFEPEDSAAARAIAEGRIIQITDTEAPGVPVQAAEMGRAFGFRSVTQVPLTREGTATGAISIVHSTPGYRLTGKQLALVKTFADQAVIAIENVRLFNETKEALERQTATAAVLRVISGSPNDLGPVFAEILDRATRLCEAEFGFVFTSDGEAFDPVAQRGLDAEKFAAWTAAFRPHRVPGPLSGLGRILSTKAPVLIADIADDEAYRAGDPLRVLTAEVIGARTFLAVPLSKESAVIGAVVIYRREVRPFSDKQVALLQTFADQAVIAIENVRLFKELEARNRDVTDALEQQTATADILKVISSSPTDVQPVFEAIAERAATLGGAKFSYVTAFDGEWVHLRAMYGPGSEEHVAGYPIRPGSDAVSARVIRDRAAVQIDDVLADPEYAHKEAAKATGFRSAFGVPMMRDGRVLGAITLARPEAGAIPDKLVRLLQTFADQAVIAIENVRLFNETKEALEHQTATAEVLQVISSSVADAKPVFDKILASCRSLFRDSVVTLGLLDDDDMVHLHQEPEMFVHPDDEVRRSTEAVRAAHPRPSRESIYGYVAFKRRVMHFPDVQNGPGVPDGLRKTVELVGTNYSAAYAPLLWEGRGIGTLNVSRFPPAPFSEKEIRLLKTFADQAVIAIQNARLFNETKEALERQTATSEILKVIASSPSDVQPVFEAIAESAYRLFDRSVAFQIVRDGALHIGAVAGFVREGLDTAATLYPMKVEQTRGLRSLLEGKVLETTDVDAPGTPEAIVAIARAAKFRSIVTVPLLREGELLGVLSLTAPDVRPKLDEKQIGLLKTFADQAVIAIENVRLFNETREALERQTATAEILRVISSSPTDAQPVFDAIVRSAERLFDPANASILMREGDAIHLRALSPSVSAEARDVVRKLFPMPFDPERVLIAHVMAQGQVLHIPDTEEAGHWPRVPEVARAGKYRSITAVPLLRDGKGIGVIVLTHPETGFGLTEKQLGLVQTFADQAVIAIENVRLFKELQSRTEALTKSVGQLTALGEVGQAISSTLDLETVLKTIVSRAVQLTGLDGGSIYEYDEQAEVYRLQAAENMEPELVDAVRRTPVRKGEGAIGRSAVTLEPTQVPDILDASYHSGRKEILVRAGYRAILAVPLLREDHLLGALQVFRRTPGAFALEIVELLKTFATQSAVAIQNARLFREIEAKGRQLEVASRHKSQFLASMSHELRTPLNAILGFNEMILDQVYGELTEDLRAPLENMQSSGKHLLRLINNVLDLAKIEAGRMELALSDYSVQDTVASVHSTLKPLAADKGLEFLAGVSSDIPLAYGDGGRIAQCLMNLAGNSLKFTKAGRVEITVEQKDSLLRYRVADTGIGIPPEKIGSLFTEFKQTDATIASEYGGTGLGLSITKKFIEMHGGRIWVESEPGKGSTFLFEIPLRAAQ
ncbi:MAG: GAF domain-containing protein [Betaproteobacteria bacterium]|nr:GAF domain-containing protein [Betaproteobacteria bacterium]